MDILAHGIGCMLNAVTFQGLLCALLDHKVMGVIFVLFTLKMIHRLS